MKHLLLAILLSTVSTSLLAQSDSISEASSNDHVFYKTISKKLKIQDKIIVVNKSPYYILQVVVALPEGGNDMKMLGSGTFISPGETYTIASFRDEWLKKIRGMEIAIKVKAAKILIGGQNQTSVYMPFGVAGAAHKEIDPELINNIKPSDITYDFDANLYEANHDLYIDLLNTTGNGVMDF